MTGQDRRVLADIQFYPKPYEIYDRLITAPGFDYKTNREAYLRRDRALTALTYLIAARISEVLRLRRNQFLTDKDKITVRGILLSKRRKAGKERRDKFRQEAFLPLTGDRANLTLLVKEYLDTIERPEDLLFNFGTRHALRIILALTGEPCHWLRAFGENYLYDHWDKDILAVADYVKVNARTLEHYIRRSYTKYKPV